MAKSTPQSCLQDEATGHTRPVKAGPTSWLETAERSYSQPWKQDGEKEREWKEIHLLKSPSA